MNLRRTVAMARKEYLHIIRDPRSLASSHPASPPGSGPAALPFSSCFIPALLSIGFFS